MKTKRASVRAKTVTRCFQRYSSEDRANHAASHRVGYLKRQAVGEFFYVSSLVPGLAFPTRSRAEQAEREIQGKAVLAA
jgi:hypothetical protein